MLVSFAVGNSVNPCFGLISSFSITLKPLLVPVFCVLRGLLGLIVLEVGFIQI